MSTLDDLAVQYGTDKSSADHGYMRHYEKYFHHLRYEPITLLELGIWEGASLRTWRKYFPNATIIGLDRVDRGIHVDGVTILIADQASDDLSRLGAKRGPFDIVIDDASHLSSKTIRSFELLYPYLSAGGVYVIEDLQTSYDVANYDFEACEDPNGHTLTGMQFCKRLADEVHSDLFASGYRLGYRLASVQFFPNICFITKDGV